MDAERSGEDSTGCAAAALHKKFFIEKEKPPRRLSGDFLWPALDILSPPALPTSCRSVIFWSVKESNILIRFSKTVDFDTFVKVFSSLKDIVKDLHTQLFFEIKKNLIQIFP